MGRPTENTPTQNQPWQPQPSSASHLHPQPHHSPHLRPQPQLNFGQPTISSNQARAYSSGQQWQSSPISYPPLQPQPHQAPYSAPHLTSPAPVNAPASKNEWSTELFDCEENPTNCIVTCFFPCLTFGQIAEILDEGDTTCATGAGMYCLVLMFLVPCFYSCSYRKKLRTKFRLASSIPDLLVHFFCECCAVSQIYRELKKQGLDPRKGWQGNIKQPQVLSEPPIVQQMDRSIERDSSNLNHYSSGSSQNPKSSGPLRMTQKVFTYEELVEATDNFSDSNLVGEGGFGHVHKGILRDNRTVAIKQLKSGKHQGDSEFKAEVETLTYVHHKNLVTMFGYCQNGDKKLLVYDYLENSSLDSHLHGEGTQPLNWSTRIKIAIGSANGLAYLHEGCQPMIIHRDIKSANILLDHKFEAKVSDFGLAKLSSDELTHLSTRIMGTFGYVAPEYFDTGKLTYKSDVYSFGVVLLELITGNKSFGNNELTLVNWSKPLLKVALDEGRFDGLIDPKLMNAYKADELMRMVACATACIRFNYKRRPDMSQICNVLRGIVAMEELSEGKLVNFVNIFGCDLVTPSERWRGVLDSSEYSTSESGQNTTSTFSSGLQVHNPR